MFTKQGLAFLAKVSTRKPIERKKALRYKTWKSFNRQIEMGELLNDKTKLQELNESELHSIKVLQNPWTSDEDMRLV